MSMSSGAPGQSRIPVTGAGGYARKVDDTVAIHCNTVVAAPRGLWHEAG